jgi:bifunctional non-homologous end joining protein LigD
VPEILRLAGREVAISNPEKVFFPESGYTKLDLVEYYLAVAPGVLGAVAGRPMALKRFVHGAAGPAFFQKRAPEQRPDWIETVELKFPSGRTAREIVLRDGAQLAWVLNLGCIDLNPHPVHGDDLEHPDELRIDLDPVPGVEWSQVREVALVTREILEQLGLEGRPKTSGSRGFHIYCRIERRWTFPEVRRAAVALARTVEAAAPKLATSKWWKEERHGVFLDYNQNAKDRTIASAYSVRPTPDARVSTPLRWDEVADCRPEDLTLATVPARFREVGDPWAELGQQPGSIEPLLELAARHEAAGLPDAPWPPHYERQVGEAPRVAPSRRRQPKVPVIEIARAKREGDARAALERWRQRHAEVVPHLLPADVLVDSMRGRSSTWTRIRVNLEHVPAELRPEQEPLEVDYDPRVEWSSRASPREG